MLRKIITFWLSIHFLLLSFSAENGSAQDLTIGIVDPVAVLNRMPEMRAVEQRIQNLVEKKNTEFTELQTNFQQTLENYQQKMGVLSDEARQLEEEQLGLMEMEIQEFQTEAQLEIEERRAEWLAPLIQKMQEAVYEVALQKDIDYLFTTTLISVGNSGPLGSNVLYMNEELSQEYDITEEVITFMDL